MSFLIGIGKSQAAQQAAVSGLQLQSSAYGKAIPIVYGTTRVAPNLIWYGDFVATPQNSSGGAGKGGATGGGKNGGGGSYTYQTSFEFGICEGPINGIGTVYLSNSVSTLSALGLSLFDGNYGQAPWGYLLSQSPTITETHTIPASAPYQVTVNQASLFAGSGSVILSGGAVFTNTILAPAVNQYSAVNGVYTFNSVNAGGSVAITYYNNLDTQALGYSGIAYVAAASYNLGSNAQLPNHNFEVEGIYSTSLASLGIPDADPSLVISDLLTNPDYGAGFPSARLASLSFYQTYCIATGLWISPVYNTQSQASSLFDDLAKATNSAIVWSSGLLTLVPYGDQDIAANGYSYTAPSSPLYDLSDDDFLPNSATSSSAGDIDNVVLLTRKRPSDNINSLQIECLDRGNYYNPAIIEAKDQALIETFGLRQTSSTQMHMFADLNAARISAQLQLQRQSICNTYQFTLDQRYVLLDPMDIVTLTDAALGLDKQWVRITEITENDDASLSFVAEEYLYGTGSALLYSYQQGQGYSNNYNIAPGNANTPIIFEPTAELTESLEVWIAVSGGPLWGGCDVYISNDGNSYKNVGTIHGASRMGLLTASLATVTANVSGQTIDSSNTLSVDLSESNGQLLSGSQSDAIALATLCYADGEYIAYQNATLAGTNQYNLTWLVRGCYGTEPASRAIGSKFVRLDSKIFQYPFTQNYIGATIYIKLLSFNIYNAANQSLADVQPYAYTIVGTAFSSPLPDVMNLRTSYVAALTQLTWDEVQDFRTVLYEIRKGAAWTGAQVLGRVSSPPFNVQGDETYWVSAYAEPTAGLQVYSETPQSLAITGTQITSNVIATYDEAATSWSGTLGGSASISGSDVITASSGTYEIPSGHEIDIGRVAPCSIIINWSSLGQHINDNIFTITDFLGFSDLLDYAASVNVSVYPEIALSQDAVTWSAWQKYSVGSYMARKFKARMQLQSLDPTVEAYLIGFVFSVDVPDRDDHYINQAIASGGTSLSWQPDGAASPVAFNGGPAGSPTAPNIQVTILNASAGDVLVLSGVSLSGCTIQILNGGSGVARNVNILAQGY